ncbi:MAG TPA: hypothetical protein VIJ59_05830 [Caulobacteraceae bacterium]
MDGPVEDLTVDFLSWLSNGPKPYAEVMEAWRTSCPRLMVWEEALDARLVIRQSGGAGGADDASVALTDAGRAWLAARRALAV